MNFLTLISIVLLFIAVSLAASGATDRLVYASVASAFLMALLSIAYAIEEKK